MLLLDTTQFPAISNSSMAEAETFFRRSDTSATCFRAENDVRYMIYEKYGAFVTTTYA